MMRSEGSENGERPRPRVEPALCVGWFIEAMIIWTILEGAGSDSAWVFVLTFLVMATPFSFFPLFLFFIPPPSPLLFSTLSMLLNLCLQRGQVFSRSAHDPMQSKQKRWSQLLILDIWEGSMASMHMQHLGSEGEAGTVEGEEELRGAEGGLGGVLVEVVVVVAVVVEVVEVEVEVAEFEGGRELADDDDGVDRDLACPFLFGEGLDEEEEEEVVVDDLETAEEEVVVEVAAAEDERAPLVDPPLLRLLGGDLGMSLFPVAEFRLAGLVV